MKRPYEADTTPVEARRICQRIQSPPQPKKKKVCFRCREEGHFGFECAKSLRDVAPRCRLDLGNSLSAVVFPSKKEPTIHLRYYGQSDDKPTQDGIVLTAGRWVELEGLAAAIDRAVLAYDDPDSDPSFRRHLGRNWYVSITPGYRRVNVRRFWLPEGADDVRPTRDGIALTFQQWQKLMDAFEVVTSHVPELRDVIPCMMREDHQNQLGALGCPECNPNDWMNW